MQTTMKFMTGERFNAIGTNKSESGVVIRLRDDAHERTYNHANGNYYYSVEFDNGNFESYFSEENMQKLEDNFGISLQIVKNNGKHELIGNNTRL